MAAPARRVFLITRALAAGLGLANAPLVPRIYDAIDRLELAMTFHRDRHTVLAGNVTNADTPGYRPADLVRTPEARAATRAWLADPSHQLEATPPPPEARLVYDDGGNLTGPDGNAVQVERELAKIDANRVRYSTSAELVSRRMALLRYAAGDGNS